MPSYVVVGASRGIGLEFVRQLANSTHLSALVTDANCVNVHVVQSDVVDHRAMKAAAEEVAALSGGAVDVLIHNAARMYGPNFYRGLTNYEDDDTLDAEFMQSFQVNVLGIIHSVNAFLPLLRRGAAKKIILVSTGAGDRDVVWRARFDSAAAYGVTKAAANMVAIKYAVQLEPEGFVVVALSPGTVDVSATAAEEPDEFSRVELARIVENVKKVVPGHRSLTPAESV
ncbi:NAD(P)-binding protein [Wolfiporia cocos MD-104 SS10]|uniref:NAD(P)-binding protein n=1 Tax=Wolfiporia cocos (strain MD-104) TaxID=742152 RepID=A0A2H3JLL3_WOLCO|nr:NAD(P)-binding protein [Wolfiporia cocos MD-104 SS10]